MPRDLLLTRTINVVHRCCTEPDLRSAVDLDRLYDLGSKLANDTLDGYGAPELRRLLDGIDGLDREGPQLGNHPPNGAGATEADAAVLRAELREPQNTLVTLDTANIDTLVDELKHLHRIHNIHDKPASSGSLVRN
jgi:hypothetical protein